MNISRILTFICLLLTSTSFAQGFLRTYTPEFSKAHEVLQTADGGYFMAGQVTNTKTLFLARTDSSGQLLWENHLALNQSRAISAYAAPDGGFVVLLENYLDNFENRNAVIKLDASGTLLWTTVIPNVSIANGLSDLIVHSDGNILIAGTTRDANFNTRNWLVKIAPDGSMVWDKIFGANGRVIKKIIELPSGDIVVSGHLSQLYVAGLTSNGDLIWEKDYPGSSNKINYDLLYTKDNKIALLGTSPNPTSGRLDLCILKTDLNGNQIWFKSHYPFPAGSDALPVLNSFTQDDAGNFYIPLWGYIDNPLDSDLELLKLSPSGVAQWKHSLGMPANASDILLTKDKYLAMVGDNNGVPTNAWFLKTDLEGNFSSNKLIGLVFRDDDVDCQLSSGEPGMNGYIIKAQNALGEVFYKTTQADGSYEMLVTEGDFKIITSSALAPGTFYSQCDTPTVTIVGASQTMSVPDIGIHILGSCPLLTVEVSGGLLRRCVPVSYNVNWCNTGNLPAENTVLKVVKSPLFIYQSSSLPLTAQSGDTLIFDIGLVPAGGCESLNIYFQVDCAANIGDVFCVEAYLTPDDSCAPPELNWDGSKIEVTGSCNGSEIEFVIKNTGTGDMTQLAEYVIIEDQIIYMQTPIQLNAGQEITTVRIPMPEDSCFALQVFPNQTSLLSRPVAVVANCTANGNLSLLLDLPNNENDPAVAIHCGEVIGSFDPNDKTGFPRGITEAHYLERGQDIEYRIRFQNTGNDTAFLVTLLDTLPATLDPATIRPIAASHPYTWDVTANGILNFTFANILLPDSTRNEPESHGFASFRISQKPNLPDGTLIENNAAIYFDFNDPIFTNTWFHTIGRPSVVATQDPMDGDRMLEIIPFPNPMSDETVFRLSGQELHSSLQFSLFDPLGKTLREEDFAGNEFAFKRKNLPAGLYFWQIMESGRTISRGRIVIE